MRDGEVNSARWAINIQGYCLSSRWHVHTVRRFLSYMDVQYFLSTVDQVQFSPIQ